MAEKKGFFKEFKAFIMRGNVVDMAVGVIIGGAFSAIVTALTNQILMPIINWILALITGGKGMGEVVTMLVPVEVEGVIDMTQSIYIDWGAFISAILNFLLIALVLFLIIRVINRVHEGAADAKKKYAPLTKEEIKQHRREGKDRNAILSVAAEKRAAAEAAEKAAAEAAAAVPPAPTTEELLAQIRDLLQEKKD